MSVSYTSIFFSKYARAALLLVIAWLLVSCSLLICIPEAVNDLVEQQGFYFIIELTVKGLSLISFIAILGALTLLLWRSLRSHLRRSEKVWWVLICVLLFWLVTDNLVGNVSRLFDVSPVVEPAGGLNSYSGLNKAQQEQVISDYRDVLTGYAVVIFLRGIVLAGSLYILITLLAYQGQSTSRLPSR